MLRLLSKRILGVSREVPPTLQVLPQFSLEKAVDPYNNPQNVGSFNKNDPMVSMGLARAAACGDGMKFHIKGDDKTRKIDDAHFKTFGCGLGVASSSAANEWVKGKQLEGVSSIKNIEIAKQMSFRPFKLHCSMFAEDAIKSGVKSYEAKRALATASEATSGETAATPAMAPVKNRLRPISPHLSIYKPQSSSMSSIFNRISGASLAALVLGFYLLCLKMPSICFTYAEFYQIFHFLANFGIICADIAAVALSYHLVDGIRRLLH